MDLRVTPGRIVPSNGVVTSSRWPCTVSTARRVKEQTVLVDPVQEEVHRADFSDVVTKQPKHLLIAVLCCFKLRDDSACVVADLLIEIRESNFFYPPHLYAPVPLGHART